MNPSKPQGSFSRHGNPVMVTASAVTGGIEADGGREVAMSADDGRVEGQELAPANRAGYKRDGQLACPGASDGDVMLGSHPARHEASAWGW